MTMIYFYYYNEMGDVSISTYIPRKRFLMSRTRVDVDDSRYQRLEIDFENRRVVVVSLSAESLKQKAIDAIIAYDASPSVNLFYLNATPMWLSKADRVSLSYAVNLSKDGGAECVTIWTTGDAPVPYSIHPDVALAILKQLEVYAMACYNTTQQHKRNVMALETAAEVVGYDYRAGYPEVLRFEM